MAKLSIKQENFCNYYLECGNASEAYRRAYSCNSKSDKAIGVDSMVDEVFLFRFVVP